MLSERKAYVMGYCWGLLEQALGEGYDKSGFKFGEGAKRPWVAFAEAHAAAIREGKLTPQLKAKLAEALWECDPEDPYDTQVLEMPRQLSWQLGVYQAKSGKPLPPEGMDIETMRRAKKLTQAQLAELMGVGQDVISRWESGKVTPSKRNQEKLKEILN